MESTKNHPAKFAFFYMLSLVALIFMSLSTGMIVFQIINKFIIDILDNYSGRYDSGALKFAISAIVISAPIYYLMMRTIHKSLFEGSLSADSGIRKWLTYLIMLVSSVVMLGWLIATLNGFLNGELTNKFLLKALTAMAIASSIFGFYFYDIKREALQGVKDKVVKGFLYGSLSVVVGVFIASLFVVESPTETRNRKLDEAVLNDFQSISNAIEQYLREKDVMPENLDILKQEFSYITDENILNPIKKEQYKYNITGEMSYELCTNFLTSNKELRDTERFHHLSEQWPHDIGEQCIEQVIRLTDIEKPIPRSVPIE